MLNAARCHIDINKHSGQLCIIDTPFMVKSTSMFQLVKVQFGHSKTSSVPTVQLSSKASEPKLVYIVSVHPRNLD